MLHTASFRTFTSAPAPGRKTQQVRGVAATLSAADSLVAKGRFQDAIRGFELVLKYDPNNVEALGWQAAV